MNEFNPKNVELSTNLEAVVTLLGEEFKCTHGQAGSCQKCSISLKTKMPWFDREMAKQKAMMR